MKSGGKSRLTIVVLNVTGLLLLSSLSADSALAFPQQAPGRSAVTPQGGRNGSRQGPVRIAAPGFSSIGNCSLGSFALDFGMLASNPGRDINVVGRITFTCPTGLPVAVDMSNGADAIPTYRRMTSTSLGSRAINLAYQLYTDSSGTSIWGTGFAGGQAVHVVGTGAPQTIRVYGRVPAASITSQEPGNYRDTVTITLSF
jgi:spore coat protein U-like protein